MNVDDKNLYIDLLVTDGDLTLNMAGEPVMCNNRRSIGQDIIHAIIESGLVVQLIAERSAVLRDDIFTQIILLVETDQRVIPGTVELHEETHGRLLITADTWDFGRISRGIDYAG